MSNLGTMLRQLDERGEHPALIQFSSDHATTTSYRQLATDIARCASGMRAAGLTGATVALYARGGTDWITACLSLIGAGAVPVPLDTQLDASTLQHILDDCGARLLLTDRDRLATVSHLDFRGDIVLLDEATADIPSWTQWQAAAPTDWPALRDDDVALIFYTSGTTGPPKGVPLRHRHLAFQLEALTRAGLVTPDDRILQPLPLHHVYPLIVGTFAPLALGLPIVLPEAMMGPQIITAIRNGRVSFIIGVPRLYSALLNGIDARITSQPALVAKTLRLAVRLSTWLTRRWGLRLGRLLLQPLHRQFSPTLRVLASGGAALDPETAWRLEGLGWRVAIGYGLTETSPLLTLKLPERHGAGSVGRPVPGIEIRIDPTAIPDDEDLAPGQGGEILARGPGVFDGYLHAADVDPRNEAFTSDGWFRTGDLGRLDAQGYLYVTGRKSTLIVTSAGKNLQPDALEELYAEHPLIAEIGILAAADGLAAVIVPAMEAIRARGLSVRNAMRAALTESAPGLPSYKRVTQHVITRTPLPRTRLGKIRRHQLEALYRQLKESPEQQELGSEPLAIESMQAEDQALLQNDNARQIWQMLAERFPDRALSPDTNFEIDLGIDSLGWLDLSTDIGQRTQLNLDERKIVEIETVRDLLQWVGLAKRGDRVPQDPLDDPEAFLETGQRRWLAPLPGAAAWLARGVYGFNRVLARILFDVRVIGLEHLEAHPRVLITPNHTSFLDPFAVAAALPWARLQQTYWGGWTGYAFRNALFRGVSRLTHIVPIDPDRAASSSLALAAAVLARGNSLVWFPEGERSASGELVEFRPGLGRLLERFPDLTVIPTRIDGAYDAWPRHRSRPRRGHITVTFGPGLTPEALARLGQGKDAKMPVLAGLRSALLDMRRAAPPPVSVPSRSADTGRGS